ncbi:type II toxin-antitoxin system VapC family toxin [Aquisphaera insulae]|uniref:type II toxin-antitoxin system VapC family toxin n=1 Tax=Aquisphaera insulae TaxID=2712864 RepID=UPI0013EDBF2F|nr:PIN domain nuclease [Aquisphaera insulae]
MILVDSSVWIDYLRGTSTLQVRKLDSLLAVAPLAIGDLILTEVLQGCTTGRGFNEARRTLSILPLISLGGADVAVAAARNFRTLRSLGVTVRKTIDTIIATRCILDDLELLHNDRDFDAFQKHLGLRCVVC